MTFNLAAFPNGLETVKRLIAKQQMHLLEKNKLLAERDAPPNSGRSYYGKWFA